MTDIYGWAGSILILVAYAGTALGKLSPESNVTFWLNFLGALGLVAYGLSLGTWPPLIVNFAWVFLTVWGKVKRRK